MTDDAKYEERYCAFVDILGFGALISEVRKQTDQYKRLRALLGKIHQPFQGNPNRFSGSEFRAQSISDAVALSTSLTPNGLAHLFFVLEELTTGLLFEGYFIRGAIVRGLLYHDDNMVFGDALMEAYRLENQVAIYPRIMLLREIMMDANAYEGPHWLGTHVKQSDDGPYFLHTLKRMEDDISRELNDNPDIDAEESEELNYYVQMEGLIRLRFKEAVDNPRHFEKVRWFARYCNSVISSKPVKGFDRIRGSGV
jgi:hypothetical protein